MSAADPSADATEPTLLREFGDAGVARVDTLELAPGMAPSIGELALRIEANGARWVLVRTPSTADAAFSSLVLVDPRASAADALDAAISMADACFGVSASRFTASLSEKARIGAEAGAEEVLARLASSTGVSLPPPSAERVAFVVARAHARAAKVPILLQSLTAPARFAVCVSRDSRTGQGPMRVEASSRPRLVSDARGQPGEVSADAAIHAALAPIVRRLEARTARPVRVSFALRERRGALDPEIAIIGVVPLRRAGLAAFALAADLVEDKLITPEQSFSLVEPRDVAMAVQLETEVEAGAGPLVKGVAAGAGIAEGFVSLSPEDALELRRGGLPPILFSHEILPDDIQALRACEGVVAVRGGLTGEAAVMARGLSKPCVASGSALVLERDGVRVTDGGRFADKARITIDGSRGIMVRGAVALVEPVLPAPVAAMLERARATSGRLVAAVDAPAHVATARRLGADDVALARPEVILFEALRDPDAPVEEALAQRLKALFEAVKGAFDALTVREPGSMSALPSPVRRPPTPTELVAFRDACDRASAETGLPLAFVDRIDAHAPADLLAARIAAARRRLYSSAST